MKCRSRQRLSTHCALGSVPRSLTIGCEGAMAVTSARLKTGSAGARQDVFVRNARETSVVVGHDPEYERRMNNWRLWRLSDRNSFGGSPFPVYNLTPRPPRGENIMPILAGEAEETDRAVLSLTPALRKAVEVWFLSYGSVNQKRKMLRCRRERLYDLLDQARSDVLSWLMSRDERKAAQVKRAAS